MRRFETLSEAHGFAKGKPSASAISFSAAGGSVRLVRRRVSNPMVRKWYGWRYSRTSYDLWAYEPVEDGTANRD